MIRNPHEQAQELIVLGGAEDISEAQQSWLHTHLRQCAACRDYAEAAGRVVGALRSEPLAADSRLVRATQMRVRFHAARLREMRERIWLVALTCVSVGVSAALTVPLLWRLFAWMGESAGVSAAVWQGAFACFWIIPVLVVGVIFLARGTQLMSHDEPPRR
jgi:predicted anti-sigma-YlaC factor YlaD